MDKELLILEERSKVKIHLDSIRATFKKVPNWKIPGYDDIHGFWFEKFIPIYDRLAIEMNRYLEETDIPEWMNKGKTTLIQKDPTQKGITSNNCRHNMPNDDTKGTN